MVKVAGATPISPFDLIQHYENSRETRRQDYIEAINDCLGYDIRAILKHGFSQYQGFDRDEDLNLVRDVANDFRAAGWIVEPEYPSLTLTFRLPGKLIENGETRG